MFTHIDFESHVAANPEGDAQRVAGGGQEVVAHDDWLVAEAVLVGNHALLPFSSENLGRSS